MSSKYTFETAFNLCWINIKFTNPTSKIWSSQVQILDAGFVKNIDRMCFCASTKISGFEIPSLWIVESNSHIRSRYLWSRILRSKDYGCWSMCYLHLLAPIPFHGKLWSRDLILGIPLSYIGNCVIFPFQSYASCATVFHAYFCI